MQREASYLFDKTGKKGRPGDPVSGYLLVQLETPLDILIVYCTASSTISHVILPVLHHQHKMMAMANTSYFEIGSLLKLSGSGIASGGYGTQKAFCSQPIPPILIGSMRQ